MRQWTDFYPRAASAPFLTLLREEEARVGGRAKRGARFREVLLEMPTLERLPALERHILEHLGRVLGISVQRLDPHAPFQGHGLDSLMSLEVKNRIEASLGLKLSAALLFTYPTAAALAEHLINEMQIDAHQQVEVTMEHVPLGEPKPARPLSDEDAAAMLDEKLHEYEDYLNKRTT
jgi:acyl carrier protein